MNPEKPFAIIEKNGETTRYEWELQKFNTIADMQKYVREKVATTLIFMTPFRSITEKWFWYEAHGNEKILAIDAHTVTPKKKEELLASLPDILPEIEEFIKPQLTPEEFALIAREIIDTEIRWGNIAQVIFSQPYSGKIRNYRTEIGEAIYKNLLKQRGQYMTFFFSDGEENDFIGATPEQHLCIQGDTVTMNPIAGTLKKIDPDDSRPLRERLIEFLNTSKEVYELFQVLDEELKMMEHLCDGGGHIEWPLLRENGAVIHTEYKLVWKRKKELNSLDALRQTLHAPTLVWSPIESASQVIKKYEKESRGYYGGEIGILKPDGSLDTAILIRMAHIGSSGSFKIQGWAGVKWDSIPQKEAQEVGAKVAGMERAITGQWKAFESASHLFKDPEIKSILASRNKFLSGFHLREQNFSPANFDRKLTGKKVTIVNFRDDFSLTLRRIIESLGCEVSVVDYMQRNTPETQWEDLLILGGWPGEINDPSDPKMQKIREIIETKGDTALIGICLGCQAIAKHIGFEVRKLTNPQQWVQNTIRLYGKEAKVGQYNSYAAYWKKRWCTIQRNQDKSINLIHDKEEKMLWVQFHPESVMTQYGREITRHLLLEVLQEYNPPKKETLLHHPENSIYTIGE